VVVPAIAGVIFTGGGPRLLALVIDWAGRPRWPGDSTTVPGDTAVVEVPLLRDRAGRWHLADPAAERDQAIRQLRNEVGTLAVELRYNYNQIGPF
jgi:hypothetical protein